MRSALATRSKSCGSDEGGYVLLGESDGMLEFMRWSLTGVCGALVTVAGLYTALLKARIKQLESQQEKILSELFTAREERDKATAEMIDFLKRKKD